MNHTKNYIINSLLSNNYGKVNEVTFIKKSNDNGKEYNGVIVNFEKWFSNSKVSDLFKNMTESPDGTAKIIHDTYYNKYWIVKIHKQEINNYDEIKLGDISLPEKERINQLESLLFSMSLELKLLQSNAEKNEKKLLDYEVNCSREYMINSELKMQLEEKDILMEIKENNFKNEKTEYEMIIDRLKFRIDVLEINVNKKNKECQELKQDLYDEKCISNFIQEELYELKSLMDKNPEKQLESIK
jgi:hypothetical protein